MFHIDIQAVVTSRSLVQQKFTHSSLYIMYITPSTEVVRYLSVNNSYASLYQEKFEDAKGVIRSLKSKTDRQYNDQKIKVKRPNNNLQNTTQKTKVEQPY